jgi:MFS family permease
VTPVAEGGFLTVVNLSAVTFLVLLGLSMVAPILPAYAESFDVSYTLVGFVISSFALTRVFVDIPAGLLSRRHDKKIIMISGLVLLSTSSVLAGLATDYFVLVIARMIEGAGSALYVTSATVFLAQISGEEKRGQWMSLYMGLLLLGSIFGPTFGGFIADAFDISAPFFAYAIVAGLAIIPTLVLPSIPNSANGSASMSARSVLKDMRTVITHPSFIFAIVATFTLFFARTGVRNTLVPLFSGNNLGLDSGGIGWILTLAAISTAFTITPMGGVSDRIGRRIPLVLCLFLTAVVTVLIPFSDNVTTLTLYMIVYGAVIGLSGPMAAYVTDVSPQDKLEISMGLYRVFSDIGYVIGPLLLGYLADLTATPVVGETHSGLIGLVPFAVASIILFVSGFILLRGRDPVRDRRASREEDVQELQ